MVRRELKRDTLIRNIKRAISRAQSENLPATIKEVYAFGGILRDKKRAHDFDAHFLYDQTPEQKVKWIWFCCGFGQACLETEEVLLKKAGVDAKELRKKVYAILRPYSRRRQYGSLRKTATIDSVAEDLKSLGIEPTWVGCFSWTEVFYNPFGLFYPSIDKVLRTLLFGGMKGLQVFFRKYDVTEKDFAWPAKNYRLAWSPEKPDIEKNLEMPLEEKVSFLTSELNLFIEQLVQLKEDYSKVQNELAAVAKDSRIEIDFNKLASKHTVISYNADEPYDQLRAKCEQARQEMRTYREETTVLRNLLGSIKSFQERKDDSFLSSYPPQDLVTYWTILRTRKSDVKEKRIREILKDLGLLEDHIITIRHVGYTDYELEPDESKRKNLLRQAETAEKERRLTFKVRKIVRKMQPNTRVHVRLQDEDKVAYCTIFSEIAEDDRINKRFVEEWGKKGFKTTQSKWTLSAVKTFSLTGREALSDIEQLLVKSLDQKPN